MGVIYCLVILIGLAFSFFYPMVSFTVYGLIVVLFIVSTALGRWELVMLWSLAGRHKRIDT